MEKAPQTETGDPMSVSPAGPTPGRTPNGTVPPLRRRRQNADPLVRPKDRNKRQPQNGRPSNTVTAAQQNGIAAGKMHSMPHHPARPSPVPPRRSTPDVTAGPEPVSGFSSQPLGPVCDIPLVTTIKALKEGLRHHVARFASKKPVDPRNTDEFTRPVRLHRRDPRIPLPGREDYLAAEGENGAIDEKQKELLEAQKAERKRQQELNLAQIAPSANVSGQRKNHYGKKTQQIYRNDQTDEQRAASRLRYEEAMPWHLEDFDNKGTWVGSYEAALSDTYAILVLGPDGKFRMTPAEKWYKFTSKQQFKILSTDEAEQAMNKKFTTPLWVMKSGLDNDANNALEAEEGRASKKLYLGKFDTEQRTVSATLKADPDADDLDFEEDRFADDEENPFHEGPEEDNKEIEEKVKRDQLRANFFDNKDEKQADAEEEAAKKAKELEDAFGKSYKKHLVKREKNNIYADDDDSDPYGEDSESDEEEAERRKAEEEKKKEEERKAEGSDRDKASSKGGKASKNPSGANTPSGRASKHPNKDSSNGLKKSASSNNLKRPSSANASEASGNESTRSRKKQKKQHLAPATAAVVTTQKPPSRPMSPDYAPPTSSAPSSQRPASAASVQVANPNKRPRAEAGSGSDKSGGEMSDGSQHKRQKLKLRMSKSPERSPKGSRAVSPDVSAQRKGEGGGGEEKANGAAPKTIKPIPVTITPDEARAAIPPEGITLRELAKLFKGRLNGDNMTQFSTMLKEISHYSYKTSRFTPR
ncbi:MAG: hypothetical protein Q9212_001564 [Teloschistes hypoglaucus]